jgi:hypothetical protein
VQVKAFDRLRRVAPFRVGFALNGEVSVMLRILDLPGEGVGQSNCTWFRVRWPSLEDDFPETRFAEAPGNDL